MLGGTVNTGEDDGICKERLAIEAAQQDYATRVRSGLKYGGCTEYYKAALEAAPGVKEEPAQSDLVERIRALEIAEPMGWMDRCHNTVVAKIVELIEVAKCTTQND